MEASPWNKPLERRQESDPDQHCGDRSDEQDSSFPSGKRPEQAYNTARHGTTDYVERDYSRNCDSFRLEWRGTSKEVYQERPKRVAHAEV